MRIKDDAKKDAIYASTIHLINEIGFSNISMSKIAKQAGISASTLYVYFENQEDMFKKIYIDAKSKMLSAAIAGIDTNGNIEDAIKNIFRNLIQFAKQNQELLIFIDQANSSPLMATIEQEEIDTFFSAFQSLIIRGQKEGILKMDIPEVMAGFCYYGITQMYRYAIVSGQEPSSEYDACMINMCWDAIKK